MKKQLSEINCSQEGKIAVPDILHFVWIGDTNQANTDYIDIWRKTNSDKKVYFWCDESTSLCSVLHKSIHDYVLSGDFEDIDSAEKDIKNDAFNYFYPKLKSGVRFDDLVTDFLALRGIPCQSTSNPTLNPWLLSTNVIVRNVMALFTSEFDDFFRYYCYEIILRGNLASASDIIRLLAVYSHGGIYIDVDTLPYMNHIFHRVNQYLTENHISEDDFLLLRKTEAVLRKIKLAAPHSPEELNHHVDYSQENLNSFYQKINDLIDVDLAEFSLPQISPLGKIYVHKNLLSLGSLKRLKGIYFNNVICSHPNSKAIRIILRTMHKRYRFLENNHSIFDFGSGSGQNKYLSRILNWRSELITRQFYVTPVLTGPGLFVEVLLGLAYTIFELDPLITPSFIAEYMQDEKLGIAFYQHNLDTPEGVTSAWRK